MTNPTLEQRARELFEIARPNFHYAKRGTADGGAFEQSEIGRCLMNAMKAIASCLTFSHTGVEQAIEACAKVADGFERDYRGGSGGSFREARRGQSENIAAAIRATLPAQSPDGIAYAGAVPSPVNVEGLVEAIRDAVATLAAVRASTSDDDWENCRQHFHDLCGGTVANLNQALASLSPDGER